MVRLLRFGRKLTVPSTVEIKRQLLMLWRKDEVANETAEAVASEGGLAVAPHGRDSTRMTTATRPPVPSLWVAALVAVGICLALLGIRWVR